MPRYSRVFLALCLTLLPLPSHAVIINNSPAVTPIITAPDVPSSAAAPDVSAPPAPEKASGKTSEKTPAGKSSATAPSGIYQLDPAHASVTFKINHLGFSRYTGRFDKMEAVLAFNSASPTDSSLEATIYPTSIDTNNPKLEEDLRGDKWFNVIADPRASFVSTAIVMTGPTSAKVTGDFTLLNETHSLTLDVTLVGQGANVMMGGKPVIGFSATGSFRRSDYGLTNLLPMVGDDVSLDIEAEFDKAE